MNIAITARTYHNGMPGCNCFQSLRSRMNQAFENHRPTGFNDLTFSLPAEIDTLVANGDNVGTTRGAMIMVRAGHMPMFADTTAQKFHSHMIQSPDEHYIRAVKSPDIVIETTPIHIL